MKTLVPLLVILLTTLISCTKKKSIDYGLDKSETFQFQLRAEPPSVDWIKITDLTSATVAYNIMVGSVDFDFSGPEPKLVPMLATKWESNSDFTKWTFHYRKDVKWSDGQPFTAHQVIDAMFRLIDPKEGAGFSHILHSVKNAKDYNLGKHSDKSKVAMKATDDYTIEIELHRPLVFFPMFMTYTPTFPIRKDLIEKYGDQWTKIENLVTLGPYKLKRWDHDKAMVFERNESFFAGQAKTKFLLGRIVPEPSTAKNLFETGKLDMFTDPADTDIPSLRQRKEFRTNDLFALYFYGFNTQKPPFDNLKVRQAVALAINKADIEKVISNGYKELNSWLPPKMNGYDDSLGLKHNISKAQKLLDEAGYKDRSKFPKIQLGYNTSGRHQKIAEVVQSQLKNNLGINLELQNMEWKVYLNQLKSDPPHLYRLSWVAAYPDADNVMGFMKSDSGNNFTGWKSKDFDRFIEDGSAESDPLRRRMHYIAAQKILIEQDTAALPLLSVAEILMINKRVKNFPANAISRMMFNNVVLD